jgi:hypothetical protein
MSEGQQSPGQDESGPVGITKCGNGLGFSVAEIEWLLIKITPSFLPRLLVRKMWKDINKNLKTRRTRRSRNPFPYCTEAFTRRVTR